MAPRMATELPTDVVAFLSWLESSGVRFYREGFGGCYDLETCEIGLAYEIFQENGDAEWAHLDAMRSASDVRTSGKGWCDGELDALVEINDGESSWGFQLSDFEKRNVEDLARARDASLSYEARRRRASAFTSNPATRRRLFNRDGRWCSECGSTEDLTLDHIKAVVNGGEDCDENLQVLCRSCNSRKGSRG